MMDFMGPVSMMQGGAAGFAPGPSRSITSASLLGGGLIGYVRSGGPTSSALGGESGGSISGTVLTGFVTDGLFSSGGDIFLSFAGDVTAELSGVSALIVGGVSCPVLDAPVSEGGLTSVSFVSNANFVASTTQTVQLV